MISCDVNVLIYAHNLDSPEHVEYATWLNNAVNGSRPFGLTSIVASAFVRIVTHPKVLDHPFTIDEALVDIERIRAAPATVSLEPGRYHSSIFAELCRRTGAKGNTVPDAYLAALAIEHDAEWNTADRGFARFPDLRWRHPLDPEMPPRQRSQ